MKNQFEKMAKIIAIVSPVALAACTTTSGGMPLGVSSSTNSSCMENTTVGALVAGVSVTKHNAKCANYKIANTMLENPNSTQGDQATALSILREQDKTVNTATQKIADSYKNVANLNGCRIVAPNKKADTADIICPEGKRPIMFAPK